MSADSNAPRSLIVGAHGQVGTTLTALLGHHAIPTGRRSEPDGALQLDLLAIAAQPSLASEILDPLHLDAIFCVGGATDVERCETDVDWAMNTNCFGPVALAKAARRTPFVYFSTEYVFDGADGPYDESAPTHALSVYGQSKLEAEQRILDVHPKALILRTTVVYGPDRQGKNFLYSLRRLLSSGQTMRVPSDQISTPTYNEDLARAAAELVRLGHTGIFNVTGPDLVSRYDFALLAADILALDPSLISAVPTADLNQKAPRPLKAGLLTGKLQATLASNPMRGASEGIRSWAAQVIS